MVMMRSLERGFVWVACGGPSTACAPFVRCSTSGAGPVRMAPAGPSMTHAGTATQSCAQFDRSILSSSSERSYEGQSTRKPRRWLCIDPTPCPNLCSIAFQTKAPSIISDKGIRGLLIVPTTVNNVVPRCVLCRLGILSSEPLEGHQYFKGKQGCREFHFPVLIKVAYRIAFVAWLLLHRNIDACRGKSTMTSDLYLRVKSADQIGVTINSTNRTYSLPSIVPVFF
jgi:hypothetical protein